PVVRRRQLRLLVQRHPLGGGRNRDDRNGNEAEEYTGQETETGCRLHRAPPPVDVVRQQLADPRRNAGTATCIALPNVTVHVGSGPNRLPMPASSPTYGFTW